MNKNRCMNFGLLGYLALGLGASASFLPACASDQKSAVTAEEVRDGEALPPAPPAPASSAAEATPAAPSTGAETSSAPPVAAPTAKEALTESQMARLTELVNTTEIEQARLAQRRAKAPGVKQFAAKMIQHHGQALREQAKLVQRFKLAPADSATLVQLKSTGEAQLAKLEAVDAASFDAAYIQTQVDAHQQALDLLDTQLIPNAKTPEIANALQTARAMVDEHLREARSLR